MHNTRSQYLVGPSLAAFTSFHVWSFPLALSKDRAFIRSIMVRAVYMCKRKVSCFAKERYIVPVGVCNFSQEIADFLSNHLASMILQLQNDILLPPLLLQVVLQTTPMPFFVPTMKAQRLHNKTWSVQQISKIAIRMRVLMSFDARLG